MGRKKIDETYKRKSVGFSLREDEKKDIETLAKSLGMKPSEVIRYLVQEAKKNQSWRNVVRNLYEIERRQKAIELYEKTHPAECTEYKTTVRTYTVYGTVGRHPAVDQHRDDTIVNEEVSNEYIDAAIADLYGEATEEQKRYLETHER